MCYNEIIQLINTHTKENAYVYRLYKSNRFFCVPLKINIQDGLQSAAAWEGSTISTESHVIQMIENGYEAAKTFGKNIFLPDRYFLTVPALRRLNQLNAGTGGKRLELVTKAKRNCIAYEEPVVNPVKKRGRPKKKGDTVYLWKQFIQDPDSFTETVSQQATDMCWKKILCFQRIHLHVILKEHLSYYNLSAQSVL